MVGADVITGVRGRCAETGPVVAGVRSRTSLCMLAPSFGYHLAMRTRNADARSYPTLTRAETAAWRDLHRQLANTRTLEDAKGIAAQAVPAHAKRFYAHLRSFVRTLNVPRRGTRSERHVYGKLRV